MRSIGRIEWLVTLALLGATAGAQTSVSLRTRIQDQFMNIEGQCGVEFPLGAQTFVAFGQKHGIAFYRYSPVDPSSIRPAGMLRPAGYSQFWVTYDLDEAPGANAQQRMLAGVIRPGNIVLMRAEVDGSGVFGITPYGVISNLPDVQRVQIEPLASNRYLIAAGTAAGEVVVYDWTVPATPASAPETQITLTPVGRLRVDSGGAFEWRYHRFEYGVRALRVWQSGGTIYFAAGGRDGIVTFGRWAGTGLSIIRKVWQHPAPVAELAVVGSRLAVALENGQVYVWDWSSSGLSLAYAFKEPFAPLAMHSLCAMPGNRLAVATAFVRVYNVANGTQVADLGGTAKGLWQTPRYLNETYHAPALWGLSSNLLYPVRVLPSIATGSYFVKMGWDELERVPRTDFFIESGGFYSTALRAVPVYALAFDGNQLAEGRADGVVQWGASTQNFNEPVFALRAFSVGSNTWLLGSYGAGNLFAWRQGQSSPIANILPAPDNPRIIYQIELVSVSASEVRFVTASGDGTVELWSWNYSNSTATRVGGAMQAPLPLHTLSVEAGRQFVAAGTFARWRDAFTRPSAWLMNLSTSGLSNLRPIEGMYTEGGQQRRYPCVATFHPTVARLVALSNPDFLVIRFLNADGTRSSDTLVSDNRYAGLVQPCYLLWSPTLGLVTAHIYQGVVSVHSTLIDPSIPPQQVVGGSGQPYWMSRVSYDRALLNVYEPHRDRIYTLIAPTSNELVTSGADRRVVRWSLRVPTTFSWASSWLPSLDFSSQTSGGYLFPSCHRLNDESYLALWRTDDLPTFAARVPSAPADLIVRALTPGFAQDVFYSGTRVRRYISQDPFGYESYGLRPYEGRVEVSEDGAWVLTQIREIKQGNTLRVRFYITPHTGLDTVQTPVDVSFATTWGAGDGEHPTGIASHATLSPGGTRIAVCAFGNSQIRIYDRVGSSWNFATPSSVINLAQSFPLRNSEPWLKFAADDVLLVLYNDPSPPGGYRIAVYQLSGGAWTLRQTLDVNWRIVLLDKRTCHIIDAVPVGSSARIAVLTPDGLRFYRLDRPGGVATLTEVGRAEGAANAFLNVRDCTWVRFSRQNPNLLSTANGKHAVVYDLSGLFSW
ncbi:MAG: hypothetical protein NZ874_03960 [Fimbriimonadales bacterium]|nr:hypothetical protein [Fimbriimonadales bacterium]